MSSQAPSLYNEAVSLLASQYNKPNLLAVVQALCGEDYNPIQTTLEGTLAAIEAVIASRELATAAGAQLDGIGQIVGLTRPDGATDETYRALIYVQISILRSSGTYEQVYEATALLSTPLGGTTPKIEIVEMFPCSLYIVIYQSVAAINSSIDAALQSASAAPVNISVVTTDGNQTPFRFGGIISSGLLTLNGLPLIVNSTDYILVSATYEEQSSTEGWGVGELAGRI